MNKRMKVTVSLLLLVCLLSSFLPAAAAPTEDVPLADAVIEESIQQEASAFQLDEDCQILRHVDKDVFQAGKHVDRLPAEEELNSYVFLNEDGSRTVYFMDEEVKFRGSDGIIREKDLTLTAVSGGYETAQNDVRLTLPDDPASGIRLSHGDKVLSLIPQGGTLSGAPEVTGDFVTYQDYFGEGLSLRYTPTLSGVKEDILLESYTGVSSFTFVLNTGGLNLYQANGRYFLAASKLDEDRVELGDIVAFDARGRFSLGTMTVETVVPGQSYRLTVTADEAFLTDESTTYPVAIDPTMEFTGTVSIEDVSIYSGAPTTNGDWTYLHAGYYDSTYKVARTLVRLPGVTGSSPYSSATAFNITSVKFYIKEATGTAGVAVGLHANTGSLWGESSVTWNNSGHVVGTQYATASPANGSFACYDITSLVKAWQSGTQTAAKGFILKSSNETSVDKAFYASEYSTSADRPYVVMTYTYTGGSLNYTSTDIDEGATKTLTVSGIPGSVTWKSSNTSIATVSSSGVVTGVKAGVVTITATVANYTPLTCTVYVTVPDGVYAFKNNNAGLYLGTGGGITDGTLTAVYDQAQYGLTKLRQLWRVMYLGNGYYSIRPMHKLDMAMTLSGANVAITNIGTGDSLAVIPSTHRWTINWTTKGYAIKYLGSDGLAVRTAEGTAQAGLGVIVGSYSSTATASHWTLELFTGVLLYKTSVMMPYTSAPTKAVELGRGRNISAMDLTVIVSGAPNNSQTVSWRSSDTSLATVNSSGTVTGSARGDLSVYAYKTIGSTTYQVRIHVGVYETIYVKNFYDDTMSDDTDLRESIPDAIEFLNDVYSDEFHLLYVMDGELQKYDDSVLYQCEHDLNKACNTEDCGQDCTKHHKNMKRIATEAYERHFERNHVTILWRNSNRERFCIQDVNGNHHTSAANAAVIALEINEESHPIPVVQFFAIDDRENVTGLCSDLTFMQIILAHEIAHTLGLKDSDHGDYDGKTTMECIMASIWESKAGNFCGSIQNNTSAFCADCLSELSAAIPGNAYES